MPPCDGLCHQVLIAAGWESNICSDRFASLACCEHALFRLPCSRGAELGEVFVLTKQRHLRVRLTFSRLGPSSSGSTQLSWVMLCRNIQAFFLDTPQKHSHAGDVSACLSAWLPPSPTLARLCTFSTIVPWPASL